MRIAQTKRLEHPDDQSLTRFDRPAHSPLDGQAGSIAIRKAGLTKQWFGKYRTLDTCVGGKKRKQVCCLPPGGCSLHLNSESFLHFSAFDSAGQISQSDSLPMLRPSGKTSTSCHPHEDDYNQLSGYASQQDGNPVASSVLVLGTIFWRAHWLEMLTHSTIGPAMIS